MGVVADAVGGVAEQPAPQLGMVAVADHDEIVAAFLGEFQDCFGGMSSAGFTVDVDAITGGFNFQAAWTTGWIAGRAMGQATG